MAPAKQNPQQNKPNRLVKEKSPYLLQHAHNPVDWYPWGEEAFEKARREDKPIFLSIGYSTCYWCHVMEREVFENDELAALMNANVVSIKVDREERPEIDRIYMSALTAMTGSGGWPMSMFLTPDLKPFFGATYIPPTPRYGRAGFGDVITRIHEVWTSDRNRALTAGENITEYLRELTTPDPGSVDLTNEVLHRAYAEFSQSYDSVHGGFGRAPKFPRPVVFNFLLRYFKRTGIPEALDMTLGTLRKMALSGMYDHVGGGFHRYATDRQWHVPHFEKMLYDQAQLVVSFLEAFQIMQDRFYADVAVDVLEYVEREMSHPDGGWYSAQDAESGINADLPTQKKEGAFYTWTYKEVKGLLTDEEFRLITKAYDVQEGGNVLSDLQGEFSGLNILHMPHPLEQAADAAGVSRDAAHSLLASAKLKLRTARMRRPAPHRDDKILVSWNGLMISAFARASQAFANPAYRESAAKAARFILSVMRQKGHLVRRYRDGEARFDAHLDDYAFLAQGLIDLYEASFDIRWLREAFNLTDELIHRMYDDKNGGFYDTGNSDPTILVRTKEFYDSAEPTGNSVAILTLLRLTSFLGRTEYETRARSSLQYFAGRMKQAPSAMPQFLAAYDFSSSKPKQIILAGEPDHPDTQRLVTEIHRRFIPNKVVLVVSSENRDFLESMVPFVKTVQPIGGKATAYVCEDFACKLPTTDPKVLAGLLDEGGSDK